MAIIKPIPTQYGIDAAYWRVMKFVDIDIPNVRASFMLYGWVDKEAHDSDKDPLDKKIIDCQGEEFLKLAFSLTQNNETVYNALKRVCELKALELEEFSGGEQI